MSASKKKKSDEKMNADEKFDKLSQEMLEKLLKKNPDYATYLGLHEPYDHLLPDGSTKNLLGNIGLMEEWIERLKTNVNREELNDENKIDYEVVEKTLELWKFTFYEQQIHKLNPDALVDLGGLIFTMFTRNYAPLEKRVDAIAARIEEIPKYLGEFRSRFEKLEPVKLWTEIALETAQQVRGLFQFVLMTVEGKVPEKVHERLRKAVENLEPELDTQIKWLNELLKKTKQDWSLGKSKFEKLLELRELGMTSGQILQLGEKYLRELKAEREQLSKEVAPGKSVKEAFRKIDQNAPKTFEEALAYTGRTVEEARRFVREKNLATVYPDDVLLVEEMPSFLTPIAPFALMMMPAKFDKPQIGVYVVARPKEAANLGKHLNYHSIRNTAVHEAFPGHFLQGAISNRGSTVRLLAQGTETVEGWAHYCEEMMREKGFITDKETHLVQVNDMIWRAVRIIVDVKLARGEMTFDEAVGMLVKETEMSVEAATSEVRRYTLTPSYALSYLLGKHLVLNLKREMKQKLGDKFSEKWFHDTITANGYLPISMLRKIFNQKIKKLK
jgi:uncharacterized protein (DUF885 family)